jgi:protoporphyrinogen oxidase
VASVARDGNNWRVTSENGEERHYDTLVSTIPLHELLEVWRDAPQAARAAAARLRYNSLINILIGVNEDRGYPYTAIYIPDPAIVFHRLSFPKAFSDRCAPDGHSAIMAEITANEGDGIWEMSDDAVIGRALRDLEMTGLLDKSTVDYRRVVRFRYGYPVYDLDYRRNVTEVRETIEATGLRLLGRFGQFDYINSDVCVERALKLAAELNA